MSLELTNIAAQATGADATTQTTTPPAQQEATSTATTQPNTAQQVDPHVAEMQRVGKQENEKGRNAERNKILEALGVKDLDEATAILKAHSEQVEAQKTELQKAQDIAAKAEQDKLALEAKTKTLEEKQKLISLEIDPKQLDDAYALVQIRTASGKTLEEAVEDLKTAMPSMFGSVTEATTNKPNGTGSAGAFKNTPASTKTGNLGEQLARQKLGITEDGTSTVPTVDKFFGK